MRPLTPFLIGLSLFALVPQTTSFAVDAAPAAAPATMQDTEMASNASQAFDSIARQLSQHFNVDGTLTLEAQRPWTPPAAGPFVVTVIEYPKDLTSSLMLRVRLSVAGEVISEPTLLLRAQLTREVYVSKGPISRETSFDPVLFEVRNADVLRERDPVSTLDSLDDKILGRSVQAGRILTKHDLAKRPLIRRGDLCEVAAIDGSMTIVLRAQAMENGAAGDLVKVRNVESRKEFTARVVANNRAEIRF